MIKTRAQNIRLGIFITISLAILLGLVGFFTSREFFEKTDTYYVQFHDVSVGGLEVGSPVKYMGIKVGSITDITIDPENVQNIIITLELEPDTPIRKDARADINTLGITGLKTIEIRAGSNDAVTLEVGGYIQPGSSITEEITGKAEIIAQKAESVLNNLQKFTRPENLDKITILAEEMTDLTRRTKKTVNNIDSLVMENRSAIQLAIKDVTATSSNLKQTSVLMNETLQRINLLVTSDSVSEILINTREVSQSLKEAEIAKMVQNISEAANQADELLIRINRDFDLNSDEITQNLRLLRETLENLNNASRKINQDPSILFRGVNDKRAPDSELNQKK
jgi:phospholipid/cholesterol/gamma-HCH transport system substrate-binding protein